jgi:hypothetical protein
MRGSCFCGGVLYEADRVALMSHCHCTMCRKTSGAAFATWAHIEAACFRSIHTIPTIGPNARSRIAAEPA